MFGGVFEVTAYYVKNGGNDGAAGTSDGTAWATWAKVMNESIGGTFNPGDTIYFNRGDTFQETGYSGFDDNGSAAGYITLDAYGTGDKPIIKPSHDLSSTGDWADQGSNIWRSTGLTREIGIISFNSEASFGVWKSGIGSVTSQGDFYYDAASDYVDMYSVGNPGSFYTSIEAGEETNCLTIHDVDYVTVRNLDFRFSASRGISVNSGSNHIIIEYVDMSYIGGASSAGVRYGNGIEVVGVCDDITVRYCTADNIYDTAYASENGADAGTSNGHYWYRNIATNCWAGMAINAYSSATLDECIMAHNVIYGWGGEWSADQRDPVGDPRGFWWLSGTGTYSNCKFQNNVLYDSEGSGWFIRNTIGTTGWNMDYNCFYPNADVSGAFSNTNGNRTFAQWQTDMSWDANSVITDPKLRDPGNDEFSILTGSSCIDEGTTVGEIPQSYTGAAPDIGYSEYAKRVGIRLP